MLDHEPPGLLRFDFWLFDDEVRLLLEYDDARDGSWALWLPRRGAVLPGSRPGPLASSMPYRLVACYLKGIRLAGFGEMVRTLRRDAGLTGVELARRVGISQSRISRIETGHLVPQTDEVVRLADALRVDANTREQLHDQARAARSSMRGWRALHAEASPSIKLILPAWSKRRTDFACSNRTWFLVFCRLPNMRVMPIELATTSEDIELGVARRMAASVDPV
jgi:transcriptional regulator with XRE-family HTH domain